MTETVMTAETTVTEKVPQRTFTTKISPNFWVNFLVRFFSKPLFYCVVPSNCSENSLVLFVRFFGFGVLFWLLRDRQNHQNRHNCLIVLYFAGQAQGGYGALQNSLNRQNRQARHEGYPPPKLNPPFP